MHPNQILVESQRKTSQENELRANETSSAQDVAAGNRQPSATTSATMTARNTNENIATAAAATMVCFDFVLL